MTYKFNRTCLTALCALLAGAAFAGPFTPGNLVVLQSGADGGGALNNSATAVFLKEFDLAGNVAQTLPVNGAGVGNKLTVSGTATSEGQMNLGSGFLWFAGYNAEIGTQGGVAVGGSGASTAIGNSGPSIFNRVVAKVNMNGNIDLSTQLNDPYTAGNIRGAVSSDGTLIWTAGTGSPASSAGVRHGNFGGSTTTQISTTPTNVRVVKIHNGQLYASAASGAFLGVFTVGVGLPITGDTCTLLPGFPDAGTPSVYDFEFVGANTLYTCDDRAVASGGGLAKWTFNGSSWAIAYKLIGGLGTNGVRSICRVGGTDAAPILAVVTADSASRLMTITDNGAGLDSFSLVATAGANTAFRGVECIPAASGRTVTGNVLLSDFDALPTGRQVTIEITNGGTPVDTQVVALDASGNYSLTTGAPAGTYDVYAKSSHWLRKLRGAVVVGAGGATGVDFTLINADCDGDNEVSIGDYSILAAAYGSNLGDPGYSDEADINGDQEVSIGDYAILSANYGLTGD